MRHSSKFRGVTLLELFVTFSLFGLILTLVLYFYGQSTKATQRHDQGSEVYRRAHALFADIENFLHSGMLYHGTEKYLVVSPYRTDSILSENRLLLPPEKARTLSISESGLDLHTGSEKQELFRKKTWEQISFLVHEPADQDPERRKDYVTLTFTSTPPSKTRSERPYEFRRQVLLERY